ncbi:sn-glycerol-3-phosphate ABC transporter ATP-binding protein UgpC [Luteimonas composti]|uniref:Sn-glycerol-3-phosphate ABC transporter ATP-binding protein UgpC n=1 Tax=Luteimonas composti TaxID=398257 RepID=A0ABT6MLW9_9GAMM|nr:sn-glycerol-3-phosphate ABC transporter ATP-binding protein UgpC [Luteimonas composti]MDH7451616.1 sn-glycerol-3-phosphate ABC transporter ATP-binding protein UgpC [Luteimonas composti]
MAHVQLEQLRKVYPDGHVAVAGASFEVADGELLVLVGPSGCGKSTLLRMVAGLEAITSGHLRIGGRLVNDVAPGDRDIAMVFQNYALYPHMTVAENLGFALKMRRMPAAEIARRVADAARTLELDGVLGRRPAQLSGGQRQRVALGRALVRQPQVFLLDEPLSNLDARLRASMRVEIARLHRQLGATMLYVTHDQVEAMTLGQRIVVMHEGQVQQVDTPLALYRNPANRFVATFLGTPAMNLVGGRLLREDGWRLATGEGSALPLPEDVAIDAGLEGREVQLGVRPEHLLQGAAARGFDAVVEVVEPMGSDVHVHVRAGGTALVARLAPESLPEPGATVRLRIAPAQLHLFDPASGVALTPR